MESITVYCELSTCGETPTGELPPATDDVVGDLVHQLNNALGAALLLAENILLLRSRLPSEFPVETLAEVAGAIEHYSERCRVFSGSS